jgi:hypothetical protein
MMKANHGSKSLEVFTRRRIGAMPYLLAALLHTTRGSVGYLFAILLMGVIVFSTGAAPSTNDLDFAKFIPKVIPRSAIFSQPDWCLWDPCILDGGDGKFYLYYSRWPTKLGYDAWCTHAEIAFATATNASGPYKYQGVVLSSRGGDFWDGHAVFNTDVVRIGAKFFLYYTGNYGTTNWASDRRIPIASDEWWVHRNNQRIGVAVADSPAGPWKRFDKPLLDVGSAFGQTILNVPNLVIKPEGGYRLYYKTLGEGPGKFGGGVFHFSADADNPLGPFTRWPEPMVNKNKLMPDVKKPFVFHIDDHFEWIQDGRYYAIVKDHDAPFLTKHGRSLLLFDSPDGRTWQPAAHPLVMNFAIRWESGDEQKFARLEMPKILFKQNQPIVLALAALPENATESFLVLAPLESGATQALLK